MNINLHDKTRIVIKLGTSTLTHESGLLNIRKIEKLVKCLADLQNSGKQLVVVSSGAIGCGLAKLDLVGKQLTTVEKQACAAVGQCELIDIYDRNFAQYGHKIAQVLMNKDVIDDIPRRDSARNTINALISFGCIPIVNENDTLSNEQITFGSNDTLATSVARLVNAELIVNMSDIDGLYDKNPREYQDAKLLEYVPCINDTIKSYAGGAGTKRGTGGMITKLQAAESAVRHGIPMIIVNGANPDILYDIFDGNFRGTYFEAEEQK